MFVLVLKAKGHHLPVSPSSTAVEEPSWMCSFDKPRISLTIADSARRISWVLDVSLYIDAFALSLVIARYPAKTIEEVRDTLSRLLRPGKLVVGYQIGIHMRVWKFFLMAISKRLA